jgi:hypothetical protein
MKIRNTNLQPTPPITKALNSVVRYQVRLMGWLIEDGAETGRDTSSVNAAFAAMGSAI